MRAFVDLAQVSFAYSSPSHWGWHSSAKKKTAPIFENITFQLSAHDHALIVGLEGSGKTTLLHLLEGRLRPTAGTITINGQSPSYRKRATLSSHSVRKILHTAAAGHDPHHLPARIGEIAELLKITSLLDQPTNTLSSTEYLRVNLATYVIAESPIILGDDLADQLGIEETTHLLHTLFIGRTVLLTTRQAATAETLNLPLLVLSNGALIAPGTRQELAERVACPMHLDAWLEGIPYDLIRQLRHTPGIEVSEMEDTHRDRGQRIRLLLRSPRYLPVAYDVLSRAPLLKIKENSIPLNEIIARLPH